MSITRDNFKAYLANRIRNLRLHNGYTQKNMAALSGLGRSTFAMIENRRLMPTIYAVTMIAHALRMTVDELINFNVAET
jgi:transcriptional regulator with XRE-family HTH domain